MARLQVRLFCRGEWDDWRDCDSESATVFARDLRTGEAWSCRVVEDAPQLPDLQMCDETTAWYDVSFVDGLLYLSACEEGRLIRIKPAFEPGYYRCLIEHAGYSPSDVKWWDTAPRQNHWEAVKVLPRNG